MPFLRGGPSRTCQRILGKLERWFLRIYDIRHSSAIIHHAAVLTAGEGVSDQALTWHTTVAFFRSAGVVAAPFVAAAFAYDRAPEFFRHPLFGGGRGCQRDGALVLALPILLEAGSLLFPCIGPADRGRDHRWLSARVPDRRGLGSREPSESRARALSY